MYEDGIFQAFADFLAQPAPLPSGGHQAGTTDIARFMIAHLEGDRCIDEDITSVRILEKRYWNWRGEQY